MAARSSPKAATGGQLQPAANFFPRTGDHRQHAYRADRSAAILRTLDAIVQADGRWARGGILARQALDVVAGNTRPLGYAFGRVLRKPLLQFVEAFGVAVDVVAIMQAIANDDVHQALRRARHQCRD